MEGCKTILGRIIDVFYELGRIIDDLETISEVVQTIINENCQLKKEVEALRAENEGLRQDIQCSGSPQ